jgi:hypothetical protein
MLAFLFLRDTNTKRKTMSYSEIYQYFFKDLKTNQGFPNIRPTLAHYTTLSNIEQILTNNEVWFSNPLYMNDMEELRFGINESLWCFRESEDIKKLDQYELISYYFEGLFKKFNDEDALDTYVFCLSNCEDINDTDGLLSMWRGYGADGSGAAIVFDTAKFDVIEDNGLIIAEVFYATQQERKDWIKNKLMEFVSLVSKNALDENELSAAVYYLFQRFKFFALFTKHKGFAEEREWRVIYDKERDTQKTFESMFSYAMTKNGIEPKFKFNVNHEESGAIEKYISKIILGPSYANSLSIASFKRMLASINKKSLQGKVFASTIPYRP